MAAPKTPQTQMAEVFNHRVWQEQANQPGTLERISHQWATFLATKGQGVQASLADVQLAYRMLRNPQLQIDTQTTTVLIMALLSLLSPFDLMPDAVPLLGMVDVLVTGYALRQAAAELERYRQTVAAPSQGRCTRVEQKSQRTALSSCARDTSGLSHALVSALPWTAPLRHQGLAGHAAPRLTSPAFARGRVYALEVLACREHHGIVRDRGVVFDRATSCLET